MEEKKEKNVKLSVQKAFEKFFNIEIKEIEKCCNNKREELLNEFKREDQNDIMKEYNIQATFKEGIEELTQIFQLSIPTEINIEIVEKERSTINPNLPADCCSTDGNIKKRYAIRFFLDKLDFSNNNLKWINFEESVEDIAYHEFFHTCGEDKEIGKHDGTLRINKIGIKCIKELLKEGC